MAKKKKAVRNQPAARRVSARAKKEDAIAPESLGSTLRPGILVTFRRGALKSGLQSLQQAAGAMRVAASSDFGDARFFQSGTSDHNALLLEKIGAAVVDIGDDEASRLFSMVADDSILSIDPEPIFFALEGLTGTSEIDRMAYLRGYRDGLDHACNFISNEVHVVAQSSTPLFQDTKGFTWGLQALGVSQSPLSGRGVKVAVLDTGFDLDHPDFRHRSVTTASFIPDQLVDDLNGHGTHCIGTSCGPRDPSSGRGYGVAYEAEIFAGKVLSNQGSSLGRSTLAGIEWAIEKKVDVISLSLGSRVVVGQRYQPAFENAGAAAVENGAIVIAAAGNDSRRANGEIDPVGSPANCPSFLAVAAVDRFLKVADFSNGGLNPDGGQVELAGPGVGVYSSAPEPAAPRQPPFFRQWSSTYDAISGTSMATPHVAGVAALLKEAHPSATPAELRKLLTDGAKELSASSRDVGAGLVQAPRFARRNGVASIRVID